MKIKEHLVVCLILSLAFLYSGCGQTELQHGLSEEQANEVLVVLQQSGIEVKKVREEGEIPTWMIEVPGKMAEKSWRVMKQHDLPRPPGKGFAETFGKQSLIPTAMEEKALYLQALCSELEKTIQSMDGVIMARVHVVLPEEQLVPEENATDNRPKAAVLIKYRLNAAGEVPYREDNVRALVANSIQKLDPKDVVVVGNEIAAPPAAVSSQAASYVIFGPLKVSPDSVPAFKIAAIAVFGLIALLSIGLIFSARRSSNLQGEMNRIGTR